MSRVLLGVAVIVVLLASVTVEAQQVHPSLASTARVQLFSYQGEAPCCWRGGTSACGVIASAAVCCCQRAGALLNEYTDRLQKENAIDAALTQKALTDLQIAKNASSAHLLSVEQAKVK